MVCANHLTKLTWQPISALLTWLKGHKLHKNENQNYFFLLCYYLNLRLEAAMNFKNVYYFQK